MKKLYFMVISKKTFIRLWIIASLGVVFIWGLLFFISQGRPISTFASLSPKSGGKLAIIIDDFGSSREGVEEMMSINRHLTFAVMPFCPHSQEDAEAACKKGYEVIVHLPMEPNYGKMSWLGPHPILAGMKEDEVRQIVRDSFEDIPSAVGANIHMGSKASSDESIISAILDIIKEKDLYFVDSRTAAHPIVKKYQIQRGYAAMREIYF